MRINTQFRQHKSESITFVQKYVKYIKIFNANFSEYVVDK